MDARRRQSLNKRQKVVKGEELRIYGKGASPAPAAGMHSTQQWCEKEEDIIYFPRVLEQNPAQVSPYDKQVHLPCRKGHSSLHHTTA